MWSSSGSGKKPAPSPQEMVQVDRSEYDPFPQRIAEPILDPSADASASSASPFWRPPVRDNALKRSVTSPAARDPNLVVGAAYSHADMLKFDSLYVALVAHERDATCSIPLVQSLMPWLQKSISPQDAALFVLVQDPSPRSFPAPRNSGQSSPPFKSYINFLSNTNDDWKADEDEMLGYDDDDGDDFGLPSLSNMKRRSRRIASQTTTDPSALSPALEGSFGSKSRRLSNSADIAIERPTPTYPMPKKSEGKILRPQYKEILRGRQPCLEQMQKADKLQTQQIRYT
ncbi:hypothetical protein ACCO45_012901 [Purpureocillium lilacinum]|uniref:Uncharacterized protein n=1 Tax=Purpureocillium lilacinum TaxID=33203 RepID=A0ACC4DCD2_PURLI